MKKVIIVSIAIFAAYVLYDIYGGYYAQKKKEMNEILNITKDFNHIYMIISSKVEGGHMYKVGSDTLQSINLLNSEEFDKYVLKVEGIENASSNLYLNDFVEVIIIKDGNLSIHFTDVTGATNINEQWMEEVVR